MKRWLFISGIVIIALLTAVWVYLLFFGATAKDDLYAMFGFDDTTDPNADLVTDVTDEQIVVDTAKERLRQLTTKPVIGFIEITNATTSTSTLVHFVEAGTGHVFSINLESGEEKRISNITVPMAQIAKLSDDGKHVAIKSGEGSNSNITIVSIDETGAVAASNLDEASQNFAITNDGELLYTSQDTSSTVGRAYNFENKKSRTLFSIPFRDVVVAWGNTAAATHTFYPKAASRLEGALYSVTKGVINRTPISGYGLTAVSTDKYSIYAKQYDNSYKTYLHYFADNIRRDSLMTFLPEKCIFLKTTAVAVCARSANATYDISIPDSWYQGSISYSDDLWSFDLETTETQLVLETLPISGRELDIVDLQLSGNETSVYFKNKNDQTLWLFDSTIEAPSE